MHTKNLDTFHFNDITEHQGLYIFLQLQFGMWLQQEVTRMNFELWDIDSIKSKHSKTNKISKNQKSQYKFT